MTRTNNTTGFDFNEEDYRDQLIRGGVSPSTAAMLAKRTAAAKLQEFESKIVPISDALDMRTSGIITESKPIEAPATAGATKTKEKKERRILPLYDYRNGKIPARVRDLIEAHLAIEREDAKDAGSLGFMTRALAMATLPHRSVNDYRYVRRNGDFTLTMITSHSDGLPYGSMPRVLLTWVCSEAVRTGERVLHLGDSLSEFLDELGMHRSGGQRGDITRLRHAMTTLFSTMISAEYQGAEKFKLANVLLADGMEWWEPQSPDEAGKWQSTLQLSAPFHQECIEHPIPIDARAIKALRRSPLALDTYVWLTHRMSYLQRRTTIPWVSLAAQFGAAYSLDGQGLRDFKRAFLRELKNVLVVYPEADVRESHDGHGLVLYPSRPHIAKLFEPKKPKQGRLQLI